MKNWAGNLEYSSSGVARPSSVAELAGIVAEASRIKPLGSRHSFNKVADTDGTHLLLDALPQEIELDTNAGTVKVSGGVSYGSLCRDLEKNGFAIHNLASLPHISVAGAIQTGTHGSGVDNPSLAGAVASVDLVRASGEQVTLTQDDGDQFLGSVVGLGAHGVVTAVELSIRPSFQMRQRVLEDLPWDRALADFRALVSSAYSVSLFTDYAGDSINQVWLKALDSEPAISNLFGATAATRSRHPLPDMSAENCTGQLDEPGPWLDRLPHFRHEFTPSNGEELQSEFILPLEHAPAAIEAVRTLAHTIAPLLFVSEIRTGAADNYWLSPFYQQQSVALHFTWKPLQAEVEAVLPELEQLLRPFGARPHWGKLFTPNAYDWEALYPRFTDFRALAAGHDPDGKFRNALLDSVLGAPVRTS
ncbi:D-arabinono-1,4-lactone oxidase [Pseudarthrobacter sp. J75]|uniref:FAD-binding protein n=1 Tax=unclassified Pseudarthrobacter TaxID=2647000 RepID=UPI002E80646A|nr:MULTISPECIES: D-arabinono-1,4-lactone oxidase [unclassified Pseudarthrobacter]MEE2523770.1 D-arabinono-1,4-lactone oxidase [Pseudarthrobacter sp. J47]MEE2529936.1 D-arabinono-1,4-lactone oxidase [Pseudarthrobacter sp. J75]